ncbi:immunoglobulin-like domain-containing protein [Listeria booriae]|uniref:immunoglobulin-like domain-containing protein n=1 Tax=Listeria booriae TaxID=1552123 RepID=UPI001E2D1CC2|nr:immunoglobulin-like domain-containing protein [Listeria booriae]MCD2208025.1 hypothetical protein [Listeria booriae]
MTKKFTRIGRKMVAVSAIIMLFIGLMSTSAFSVYGQTVTNQTYAESLRKIGEAVANQDHTPLPERVTWKFKWLVFTDVTFNQANANPEHRTLSADDETYAKTIADDFKRVLEKTNPNILVDIDLEFYKTPIQVTTSDNDFILHESQIASILEEKVPYGAFDAIFALSDSPGGGGVTKPTYYSDITRGAGYCAVGLSNIFATNYPQHSKDREIEYSTDIALHEFCHLLNMANLIDSYPDVHGATKYNYSIDPKNGWMQFYLDFLTGNVVDPKTGKLTGVYPEMWRLTPSYMRENVLISGGVWGFRPNGAGNLTIDSLEKVYVPLDYTNLYGSPWFDFMFSTGADSIDSSKIKSNNTDVIQVLNFGNEIARIKPIGIGETNLDFPTKDGQYAYTKTIVIYDEGQATEAVNGLFERDTIIKDSTDQDAIDKAQTLVDLLPTTITTKAELQKKIDTAKDALNNRNAITTPIISPVSEKDTRLTVTGLEGARIAVVLPDGTIVSKTANAQGTATFYVTDLKAGDIITARQTKNGITSKQAAITVTPDQSEVVTVTTEGFMIGKDSYIKGTYTGDVAKLAIEVNGTLLQKINVPNSPYQYYAKGKVTVATDQVYVITYDSNDNQLEKTKVDVKSQIKSTLTPNPFYIGKDNYVTGQLVGDITKFSLTVNGIEYTKINVTTAPDFKYYANNVIKNTTDIVQINGYSATGNLLDSKPVTIANTETGKITSAEAFKIGKDSYITATYTGDITKAELQVNGTALQRIGVTNGTIKYYAKTNITNTSDEVKLVTYNSAGQRADSKIITISSSTGKITANPVKVGDSYLTGTATGDIAKVALRVNGVTQTSVAFMQIDGIYKYYIKSLHLKPTDEVKIIGLDGRSNEIHTSDVTITN